MKQYLKYFLLIVFTACAHNETLSSKRSVASTEAIQTHTPIWENDVCVLKSEFKENDYIVRFSDIHSFCPPLRDYNPAGAAYSKLKGEGRGVHIPACRPQPVQSRNIASKCWMGLDVFGQNAGSCELKMPQQPCTSCSCGPQKGVAWQ